MGQVFPKIKFKRTYILGSILKVKGVVVNASMELNSVTLRLLVRNKRLICIF